MHRVRVKIEGLRDAETALAVARLGADAVGLVFAPSPRQVTAEQARAVTAALPPWVASVGVFVNADPTDVRATAGRAGVGFVQLHGDEPPETLDRVGLPCIKAFRIRGEESLAEMEQWLAAAEGRPHLAGVVLDAYDPAVRGGSGRRFDWGLLARARRRGPLAGGRPIILAGGLTAECVGEAIRAAEPWAVDVASGVESAPGVKDLAKVEAFLRAVRAACEGGA